MGQYQPYDPIGQGAFVPDGSGDKSKQARYAGDQLLVDLAYSPITQKGSGQAETVDLYAEGVPFEEAIRMIIPQGWQLYKDGELSAESIPKTINLTGRGPWTDMLARVGQSYELSFFIDWYQRTIIAKKGQPAASASQMPGKIKVIPEPAKTQAQIRAQIAANMRIAPDAPSAAPASKPIAANSLPATGAGAAKPLAAKEAPPITKVPATSAATKETAKASSVEAKKVEAKPSAPIVPPKPVALPPPPQTVLYILPGTLHDNVVRLSKKEGWSPPEWKIDGDFLIKSGYTITAKNFQEAMAKLLMLHPIEADVNVAQHKVVVLREIQ